jgi:hypothetical protein
MGGLLNVLRLYFNQLDTAIFSIRATQVTIAEEAAIVTTTDTNTNVSGNVTPDFAANSNFVWTLTGNIALVNLAAYTDLIGRRGTFTFIQDGTGSRGLSSGTDYENAPTLTTSASASDTVDYRIIANNRIIFMTPVLDHS